ncbi:MAG: hypothetical protein RBG13Loki_3062 [Promethearchaeota archaeon CR_4]|nr:MAG: hypothetical protein RBG13Loki_3062 [Candidatus Lokiarchaeota archaeon CR_4]
MREDPVFVVTILQRDFDLDIIHHRVGHDRFIRYERPRRGSPDDEPGIFIAYFFEFHKNGRISNSLIIEFMLRKGCRTAWATILGFIEFIEQPVFPRFLERPPDSFQVRRMESDVRPIPRPECATQPYKSLVHFHPLRESILPTGFYEAIHTVFFNFLLVLNTELLLNDNFNR